MHKTTKNANFCPKNFIQRLIFVEVIFTIGRIRRHLGQGLANTIKQLKLSDNYFSEKSQKNVDFGQNSAIIKQRTCILLACSITSKVLTQAIRAFY